MGWSMEETLEYYKGQGAPSDQTALVGLLREIQQEHNGIPRWAVAEAAGFFGVKESYLCAVIKRIPSLRLADSHHLELCSGPNCGKRTELAAFVERTYGKTPAGFTWKYCGCMRLCGKGPNIKWDGKVYHQATPELIRALVEDACPVEG